MLEIVLVFFPITKTRQSHKFTSFWMVSFEVIEIISEVLLKIKNGMNRGIVTIHVDRVCKVRKQALLGAS